MNRENLKLVLKKVSLTAQETSSGEDLEETKSSIVTLIKLATGEDLTDMSDHHLPVVLRVIDDFSKTPTKIKLLDESCTYCGCDPCDCDWGYDDYIEEFGERDFNELVSSSRNDDEEDE